MSQNNNYRRSIFPKQFLFRLTFVNVLVIASFILISGWLIYNTACALHEGITATHHQSQFETTLLQYLWIFILSAILIGSLVHYYFTKKLLSPLKDLIDSAKMMKKGKYPEPLKIESTDEIGQLRSHFNDLVVQLRESEEHRKRLFTDLSHEFRTPLSNLNGYLNALSEGVIEGNQDLYQSLYIESNRLANLVDKMEQLKEWDFTSKQTIMKKEAVEIDSLIHQCVHMFSRTAEQKNIEIETKVEPEKVELNFIGISQVISNILDNAIKYYEGSGPIKVEGKSVKDGYLMSVTGPGKEIPQEVREKIFDRFYRADHTRTEKSGSAGLGLAITKEIVERHSGELWISSNNNEHTFWVKIPTK